MIICLRSRAQNDERRQTTRTEVTSEQQAECPLTFAPSLVADAHFIKRTVNTPACLHMLLMLVHWSLLLSPAKENTLSVFVQHTAIVCIISSTNSAGWFTEPKSDKLRGLKWMPFCRRFISIETTRWIRSSVSYSIVLESFLLYAML